jgi:hypothetical protein
MAETRNTLNILIGKPEEKRQRGRLGRRKKDNIKKDVKEAEPYA